MSVEFWFLIGAALVFWMQAGFAMVETGFTRAKNAGNIIMKNLMDFCIGTVVFSLLGYSLMMGEDAFFGLIGKPNLELFTHFKEFIASPADGFTDASYFVFNLVFCATTATIVSGAMAERTKFSAYCVYSGVISLVIYPIEAHWIWGGGWLSKLGFHDYAGSCAIHMVGGIAALIGAILLGPRIGKYVTDKNGKVTKVNAIPGHSIPLGALGVFILWLGWYGNIGIGAFFDIPDHHHSALRCHLHHHDLHLDKERQAGRLHVSQRFSCGTRRRYRGLRRVRRHRCSGRRCGLGDPGSRDS